MGRNGAGKSTLLRSDRRAAQPSMRRRSLLPGAPSTRWTPLERSRVLAHLPARHVRTDHSLDAESLVSDGPVRASADDRWFEIGPIDVAIARAAMRRCECLAFATRGRWHVERRRAATCVSRRVSRADARVCCCWTSRRRSSTSTSSFSVSACLRAEAERGVACLAVTHDVNLALTFCTRVIVLAQRAVAHDSPGVVGARTPDVAARCSRHRHSAIGEDSQSGAVGDATSDAGRAAASGRVDRGSSLALFIVAAAVLPFVGPSLDWMRTSGSGTTPIGRSSRSCGSRARCSDCSPADRWRWPAACFSRCFATRSPRRTRSACRPARRSAPWSRSRSDWHTLPASPASGSGRSRVRRAILVVVMGAATRRGQLSSSGLLLSGIAINSVCARSSSCSTASPACRSRTRSRAG